MIFRGRRSLYGVFRGCKGLFVSVGIGVLRVAAVFGVKLWPHYFLPRGRSCGLQLVLRFH